MSNKMSNTVQSLLEVFEPKKENFNCVEFGIILC